MTVKQDQTPLYVVTLLTFGRFPLVLLFFSLALWHSWHPVDWKFWLALVSLAASAITDAFDGYLARKYQVTTAFGAHADPLMDKFFYLTSLPLLVYLAQKHGHPVHAVFLLIMTLFFLVRDQWVTFLRSIGSMYNVSGGASWLGKFRTGLNFPLICVIYFYEAAPDDAILRYIIRGPQLYIFEAVGFVVNLLSMVSYTQRYWPCLLRALTDKTR